MKPAIVVVLLCALFVPSLYSLDAAEPLNRYVFDTVEDEYVLASYFFTTREKQIARSLKGEDRWEFIGKFWQMLDPNPVSDDNEFLTVLRARIAYANINFGGFKPGWKTDRGRIYIKYGPPYDVLSGTSSSSTNYIEKDYKIWKYRIQNNFTYIFLDIGTSGDLRLIFSNGDDSESSLVDWLKYIGYDFDLSLLY